MNIHVADQLLDAIDRSGSPVCVGLDPVLDRLPADVRGDEADPRSAVEAIRTFCAGVIEAIAAFVPCVKPQSACFERYGPAGCVVLEETIALARERGLEVILDAKRGDIGISASHYSVAVFGEDAGSDRGRRAGWVTINAYLGDDGIRPFLESGGAFALVRTSNPGGDRLQSQRLADGRTVAESVAEMVAAIGDDFVGRRGYSALGAVVGATKPADAARLREIMPRQIFLVPGYGAQGGGVDDVRACFDADGGGAIVTASRSVIYAGGDGDWRKAVADAARRFADEVAHGVGMR